MRIASQNINNSGIVLSRTLINKSIFKYNGVLGRALFKLYDLGYQSSPSVFDEADFRSALSKDFPSEMYLLRDNLRGKISIDDESMVRYATLKSSDEDFKDVMSVYLDLLIARNALDSYNTLVSRVKIPKKNDKFKVKVRLGVSGSVKNYNSLPLDNSAIRESFLLEDDEELVTYNTSEVMIKEILKRLGYSDEEYYSHKDSGQPFFILGVSQKDELSLLPIIISGKIIADGKFGSELVSDIQKYYNDFYSIHTSRIHCLNYEEIIFNSSLNERISMINDKRADFKDKQFRDFYVTTDEIVFAVKSNTEKFSKPYFKDNKLHLGIATLSHENRCEFSKINTLCGLCGEFVHENVVRNNDWVAEGTPISIKFGMLSGKKFKMSELLYYPLYNVYYSSENGQASNIKPLLGNDIHILVSNLDDIFKRLGVSSKYELFDKFLKATDVSLPSKDIIRSKYEELVADLATALVYAECGELDYDLCKTGYTWVTDEIFYRASVEAEELFKSFGF